MVSDKENFQKKVLPFHQKKVGSHFDIPYNINRQWQYRTLDNIPENTPYCIYLDFYDVFFSVKRPPFKIMYNFLFEGRKTQSVVDNPRERLVMPKRVWEDSGNGLVHWIVDYSTEAQQFDDITYMNWDQFRGALNAPSRCITHLTGGIRPEMGDQGWFMSKNGNPVIYSHVLKEFLRLQEPNNKIVLDDFWDKKISSILKKEKLDYKALTYNRLPRHERVIMMGYLYRHGLEKETIHSLGTYDPTQKRHSNWGKYFHDLKSTIDALPKEEIHPVVPETYPRDSMMKTNLAHKMYPYHALHSSFQIVSETYGQYINDLIFITEKSFKPALMMQPWVTFGNAGNVQYLRDQGYHMFDDLIDHSYDREKDGIERLRLVLKEIARLHTISKDEWPDILYKNYEKLYENMITARQPFVNTAMGPLSKILNKHFGMV